MQLCGIKAGDGRDRELCGLGMAGQQTADQTLPVQPQGEAAAEGGVIQSLYRGVDADILKNRSVGVDAAGTAGNGNGIRPSEIGYHQLHLMGGKTVDRSLLIRRFRQHDALDGLGRVLPPVLAGQQAGAAAPIVEVGAGADGNVLLFRTGF